jgi:serine O-acetyltransferase
MTVKKIFKILFPFNENLTAMEIDLSGNSLNDFTEQIFKGVVQDEKAFSSKFIQSLPGIKSLLLKDAQFILESDPAARDLVEVIAVYPGFFAIYCYRIAHSIHITSVPLLPRMITEYAHKITGIDIHPGAEIGNPFSIDHGTGIVIGETTWIGNYVKLYQGVTLGALSVDKSKASSKRHPTIEDNVILYAGSTILGGETVVGHDSIIGGNVWLTQSVDSFSVVYHKSEIVVREQNKSADPINFII